MRQVLRNLMPTAREVVAAVIAVTLAMTVVMVFRTDTADAGGGNTEVVFIATGENYPDALGAGPAAAIGLGPILLVQKTSIPGPTLNELNRLEPPTIYVVGGAGVIADSVVTQLENLSFGPTVIRIAGTNRYDTAAQLSNTIFPTEALLKADDRVTGNGCSDDNIVVSDWYCSATFYVPKSGILLLSGSVDAGWTGGTGSDRWWCRFYINDVLLTMTDRDVAVGNGNGGGYTTCASDGWKSVAAGNYTVKFTAESVGAEVDLQQGAFTAIFIPYQ